MRIPILSTLWKAAQHWSNDNASYMGAALAYYALFSIAPCLIIAIAIVGMVFGEAQVKAKVISIAQENIGAEGARALENMVEHVWKPATTIWAVIVGPTILIIAACNFFLQLGTALTIIWNLPSDPHRHWIFGYLRSYIKAVLMVLVFGFFLLLVMVGDVVLGFFLYQIIDELPGARVLWASGHRALFILLFTILLVFTFRFLSHGHIPYRKLIGGALVASLLMLLGRVLFTWYVTTMGNSLTTAFGAASSVVIFLMWVYYSTQILFFGAEVVKVGLEKAASGPMPESKSPTMTPPSPPVTSASRPGT